MRPAPPPPDTPNEGRLAPPPPDTPNEGRLNKYVPLIEPGEPTPHSTKACIGSFAAGGAFAGVFIVLGEVLRAVL